MTMQSTTRPRPYTMWCLGLSEQDEACICRCAGAECRVTSIEPDVLQDESAFVNDEPTLVWVHAKAWHHVVMAEAGSLARSVPKVMVMDAEPVPGDLDVFMSADADHVARGPLVDTTVYTVLRRTLEACNIHHDMCRMTREIFLQRELLTRKSDTLAFMLDFVDALRTSGKPADILVAARQVLSGLLPVRSLHAALWQHAGGHNLIDIYLDGISPDSPSASMWENLLQDAASRLAPGEQRVHHTECLLRGTEFLPDAGHLLLLPLSVNGDSCGTLLLLLRREISLSRDQNMSLNAALSYLGLALRLAGGAQGLSVPREAGWQREREPASRLAQ